MTTVLYLFTSLILFPYRVNRPVKRTFWPFPGCPKGKLASPPPPLQLLELNMSNIKKKNYIVPDPNGSGVIHNTVTIMKDLLEF